MKLLNVKLISILFLLAIACTSNKEQSATEKDGVANVAKGVFEGEYLVGDGSVFIVPVNDTFELRNEKGESRATLYLGGIENDTIQVYATKDKSITFKMNPGHKAGMYFETDEQWPVSYLKPIAKQETEAEESERIFKQRHIEDSVAFTQLGTYDGTYSIKTESEGVNATLTLHYNGDQTFNYEWSFDVAGEEASCKAKRKGIVAMDRTQHGLDSDGNCTMHFNFNGLWNDGYVIEIDFEDQAKCSDLIGQCTFSGTYIRAK